MLSLLFQTAVLGRSLFPGENLHAASQTWAEPYLPSKKCMVEDERESMCLGDSLLWYGPSFVSPSPNSGHWECRGCEADLALLGDFPFCF